jgi:RimJ/RimL family protein N-acetyltransferase
MGKPDIPALERGRVRLRLLQEADLPMTRDWRNQDHIRRWFIYSGIITPEQHERWWRAYRERDDDFVFVIEETETLTRPVGQVSIYNIDRSAARAEFGRLMIGEDAARGLGIARLATAALVESALTTWGLREIYLECLEDNSVALAIYEACGFRETARNDGLVHMTRSLSA